MIYKEIFTFIWFVRNMSQCTATPVAPASHGSGPRRHHHVCGRAVPAWWTGWSWSLTLDEETSWCMFPEMAWSYYSFKSAHLYAMLHIWISINELFQDWNCNVYFLPCSDEQNTPKRHIYQRGQRVLTTLFFPAIHISFPLCDLRITLPLCRSSTSRKTPLLLVLLICAQSGDTRKHEALFSPLD